MGRRQKPEVDWALVERRLKAGESAYAIAKEAGVTKQGILQRATKEGWDYHPQQTRQAKKARELRHIAETTFKVAKHNGKATVDTKLEIIESVRDGVFQKHAALAAGITEQTLINWKREDLAFCAELEAAAGEFVKEAAQRIKAAGQRGDWKADQFLLGKHSLSKAEYAEEKATGGPNIQIVIAMPKPGQGELEAPLIDITPIGAVDGSREENPAEEERENQFVQVETNKPRS